MPSERDFTHTPRPTCCPALLHRTVVDRQLLQIRHPEAILLSARRATQTSRALLLPPAPAPLRLPLLKGFLLLPRPRTSQDPPGPPGPPGPHCSSLTRDRTPQPQRLLRTSRQPTELSLARTWDPSQSAFRQLLSHMFCGMRCGLTRPLRGLLETLQSSPRQFP
ncbi:hypothetical protein AAFF_G00132250 [Aldrovandia affinis]|uniref:Uncharacterized protein n=1 Tax=Aldrovandia affinis TaxID=143900 RepID=A0AAD7W943_9TELE|nr:hypothetical protein AAFF_G00132250 [Aldrovandia affinis]